MVLRLDVNESKWTAIWGLSPFMPQYNRTLFKYARSLFASMNRTDLIEDLDQKLALIEKKMGTRMAYVFWVYENLPALNSFTKSRNPTYEDHYIHKHTIATWFQEIEDWIFEKLVELEQYIRFTQQRPL